MEEYDLHITVLRKAICNDVITFESFKKDNTKTLIVIIFLCGGAVIFKQEK
jgi:hypothetical protein